MIKQTLIHMMNHKNDEIDISEQILKIGLSKVFQELSKPFDGSLSPEQILRLLSVFHYMIQQCSLPKDVFADCNISMITNTLNTSFVLERLPTELNLTISKSVNVAPSWDNAPKQSLEQNYFKDEQNYRQSATDKKIYFQEVREPLTYQQILQVYYIYLKRVCMQQLCDIPVIDCFVIQNIQCLGLRIIEGQRNSRLRFCFDLILKDLVSYQNQTIDLLSKFMSTHDMNQTQEIYLQMYLVSKQLKYYCNLNRCNFDQSKFKEFKKNHNLCTYKYKICESKERMERDDLKDNHNFYKYERTQLYNQF
ncbi:unnamed protein product (macronuclear) [Paramecium tetraurelia]|uniref:EF-hand domain-containing protein n=1 Tax=Paramecium tetraurelia TaxID=5888 RepID=A0BEF5_PARTE|nr:uncharacterized protein GSPATT00027955001 [Paramecium tetraurelia]CAK56922.1 unnamed protein product [Paramecium tetraurelia]|eukprot:XP_001424320.1 hypothetical protein (macronuclear) [Paramecium tetraurelia strain d4-2]